MNEENLKDNFTLTLNDLSNTMQAAKKRQAYDDMIRSGRSLRAQEAWMRKQGFAISKSTLSRDRKKIDSFGDRKFQNHFLLRKKRNPKLNSEKRNQIDREFKMILGHIACLDQGLAQAFRWIQERSEQIREKLQITINTAYRKWNLIPEAMRPRIAKDHEDHFKNYAARTKNILSKPDDCWQMDEWVKAFTLEDKFIIKIFGVSTVDECTETARAIKMYPKPINRVCFLNAFKQSLLGNKALGIPMSKPKMIRFDNAKIHEPEVTDSEQPLRTACALLNIEHHCNHEYCPREDAQVENSIGNLKRIFFADLEYYLKEVLKIRTYQDWIAYSDCIQQKLDDFIVFWNMRRMTDSKESRIEYYLKKRTDVEVASDEIDFAVRYIKRVKLQNSGIRHDGTDYHSVELVSKVGRWVELRLRPECDSPDIDVYYEGKFLCTVDKASGHPHLKYELQGANRRVYQEQQTWEKALKEAFAPLYIQKLLNDPAVTEKEKVRMMEVVAAQNSKVDSAVDKSEFEEESAQNEPKAEAEKANANGTSNWSVERVEVTK